MSPLAVVTAERDGRAERAAAPKLHTLADFEVGQRVLSKDGVTAGTVLHVDPLDDEPLPFPVGVLLDHGFPVHFEPHHLTIID